MIDTMYANDCNTKSDINEHLPTLRNYASEVAHVTEFGVRHGVSTVALASGRPRKLISYDIGAMDENLQKIIKEHIDFEFIQKNVLQVSIAPTDLLFIDTLHTYLQMKQELMFHSDKVRKYIICHDTQTFAHVGEDGSNKGIVDAIFEFIQRYKEWSISKAYTNNNGLMILRKEY